MEIVVLFLTLAVSTNAYDEGIVNIEHDPDKVTRPDGKEVVIDGWHVGAMTSTGFQANTQHYRPVIVRKNNGYIRDVTQEELNKLLTDPSFRIPGPRPDHIPYDVHYAPPITSSYHTGNQYGQHFDGIPHAQFSGESSHEQPFSGLPDHIFGVPQREPQHAASPRSQRGGGSPHSQPGGENPHLNHGAEGFPGDMPGGMPGGDPYAPQSAGIPNRHISSEGRSNSDLSVRSRDSRGSRGSRGSIRSQSSRRSGGVPNSHNPGGANVGHEGIPDMASGGPHVQFRGSGSLEHVIGSPYSQQSGGSQGSHRSGSGRPKSRLGPGGIPMGHPGGIPGDMPAGTAPGGPHADEFAENPGRHIPSRSRSNSEVSYRSQDSQGSQVSRGSRRRNPAGSAQPPYVPPGRGQPPQFPGGYRYEGSDAASQSGYESTGSRRSHNSAGSVRSHNSARSGRSHNSARSERSHNSARSGMNLNPPGSGMNLNPPGSEKNPESAEGPSTPSPTEEKKPKKKTLTNIFKKIKMIPIKKPPS